MRVQFVLLFLLAASFLNACSEAEGTLREGHYSAEMATFDDGGWKPFVTIYVANGKIITAEYDAKNEAGFLKSWDMDYIRKMKSTLDIYPNKYMRAYCIALLNWQDPQKVYPLKGAEDYCDLFKVLATAAISNSRAGNKEIVAIPYPVHSTVAH